MEPDKKDSSMTEEMNNMEWEPLLPVEKKLIGWSISLGIVLLFVLYWGKRRVFPGRPFLMP